MNKKVKKPKFWYPFDSKEHEESCKFFDINRNNFISNKGTKVEINETMYSGGQRKLEIKETVYLQKDKDKDKKLSDLFYFRPYNQVRMKKLIDFSAYVTKDQKMFLTRKESAKKPLELSIEQSKIIRIFYETNGSTLEEVLDIINSGKGKKYKNTQSLRQTIIKLNRKISGAFSLTSKDDFIKGTFNGKRKGYSFNPNIRIDLNYEEAFY